MSDIETLQTELITAIDSASTLEALAVRALLLIQFWQ